MPATVGRYENWQALTITPISCPLVLFFRVRAVTPPTGHARFRSPFYYHRLYCCRYKAPPTFFVCVHQVTKHTQELFQPVSNLTTHPHPLGHLVTDYFRNPIRPCHLLPAAKKYHK